MSETAVRLLIPDECALRLVDPQAGLAFGVGSIDRQMFPNNVIALAKTARALGLPIVVSTSATKVYSGPLMPAIHAALPGVVSLERRNMNVWEDEAARNAILKTGRRRLIVSGLLTEACVTFSVLSAIEAGLEVYGVGDACGGLTPASYDLALPSDGGRRGTTHLLDSGSAGVATRLDSSWHL